MLAGVRPRIRYLLIRGQLLVGVYSIALVKGDYYVNGGAGAQQLLINSGVTGIEIAGGMERVDFAYNSSDLAFKVNGLQIQILNGSNVIATISTNDAAGGTELAFKNGGLKISLDSSDPQNPAFSLTGANGSSQSIPLTQTNNVSLDKSFILNSSLTSNVGGGGGDTPTPTETTYSVDDAKIALAKGEIKAGEYILKDSISDLASNASILNGAKSIQVEDLAASLIDKEDVATSAVLGNAKVEKIIAKDSFEQIALNLDELNALAKQPALVVSSMTAKVSPKESLSVKQAENAAANLEKLYNDTTVKYEKADGTTFKKLDKAPTLDTYKIEDSAANIAGAAAKLLADAAATNDGVVVSDTVLGFTQNSAVVSNTNVDSFKVSDSLTNILSGDKIILDGLSKQINITFTADDPVGSDGIVKADVSAVLDTFGASSNTTKISFENPDKVESINLTATSQIGKDGTVDLAMVFTAPTNLKNINFTGSDQADKITASAKGGIIDGGLGADEITLAAGKDIVVLGTGINSAAEFSANKDVIKNFSVASDKIKLDGFLSAFDELMNASENAAAGGANDIAGKIAIGASISAAAALEASDVAKLFASDGKDNQLLKLDAGKDAVVIDTKGGVWYVANDGDMQVTKDEVHLVATILTDTNSTALNGSTLTTNNFA